MKQLENTMKVISFLQVGYIQKVAPSLVKVGTFDHYQFIPAPLYCKQEQLRNIIDDLYYDCRYLDQCIIEQYQTKIETYQKNQDGTYKVETKVCQFVKKQPKIEE